MVKPRLVTNLSLSLDPPPSNNTVLLSRRAGRPRGLVTIGSIKEDYQPDVLNLYLSETKPSQKKGLAG